MALSGLYKAMSNPAVSGPSAGASGSFQLSLIIKLRKPQTQLDAGAPDNSYLLHTSEASPYFQF